MRKILTSDKKEFNKYIENIEANGKFELVNLTDCQYLIDYSSTKVKVILRDKTLPITNDARKEFLERIGLCCPVLLDDYQVKKNYASIQPLISNVLMETKNQSQMYILDEEILACHSQNYKILEISELCKTLENSLNEHYQQVEFVNGFYSDELTAVNYAIKDKSLKEAYSTLLNQDFEDSKVVVRLTTSHLGLSGANLFACFYYKQADEWHQMAILENKFVLEHKGKADMNAFKVNCDKVFAAMETAPQKLEELKYIKIQNPIFCIANLAEKVGLPAYKTIPVIEELKWFLTPGQTTGIDLYFHLSTIIESAENEREKVVFAEKVGQILRLMKKGLKEYDVPKSKWKGIGDTQEIIPGCFTPLKEVV